MPRCARPRRPSGSSASSPRPSNCRPRTRTSDGSSTRWRSGRTSSRGLVAGNRIGGSASIRKLRRAPGGDGQMTLRQGDIVIDCADHEAVVPFWEAALGWERHDFNEQYVSLVPPPDQREAEGPRPLPLLFQKVPESKAGKNRVHLDWRSGGPRRGGRAARGPRGARGRDAEPRLPDLDGDGRPRRQRVLRPVTQAGQPAGPRGRPARPPDRPLRRRLRRLHVHGRPPAAVGPLSTARDPAAPVGRRGSAADPACRCVGSPAPRRTPRPGPSQRRRALGRLRRPRDRRSPARRPFPAALGRIPPAAWVIGVGYALVARNRQRESAAPCGSRSPAARPRRADTWIGPARLFVGTKAARRARTTDREAGRSVAR